MTTALRPPRTSSPVPPLGQGSSPLGQVWILTGRSLRALATDPGVILFGLLQPMVTLFMLTQVFSKMGTPPHFPHGITYLDYILPAVLVDNAVQSAVQSGVGLVDDLKNGFVARLRSLPVSPASLLVARSLTTVVRSTIQAAVILLLAITLLGHEPRGGGLPLLVSLALTLFVSWALGWLFIAAAAWLRRAEPIQNLAIIAVLPMMFISSAYIPLADLPDWLATLARLNPLTYAIDATRALALELPGSGSALPALALGAVLAAVGWVLAVRGYRRPLQN
ncbi:MULTISPECIES: ABC transporter permease [Streptomyces]|uniref:Transport permease protein n=1 Tax=Streptomyces cacaoi TaxID=1898 RepID=A0A4Y3QX00_STRCI|nr:MULTISPECIES: ABC transporter permease [Streptomyces]NNG84171.1 ABC transporter permease [Streptomyces cacaoi]QHF95144.1 ABC transporter permease [Streptomyces sp. NHF165]GEB48958.1 transport permease protein [Streptomyces cacaoi]